MIGELTNHLWQSTAFALAVALATLAFRKNRAEVRYWLWLCASLKFLIPFALSLSLGMRLWDALHAAKSSAPVAAQAFTSAVLQITQPFSETLASSSSAHHTSSWILITVLAVWACGFLAIGLMRFRGWLRIRAAVRASFPVNMPFNIAAKISVRSSPSLLEPGVVGFLNPVLLLPAGIARNLTPPQLEAVLAHEQCHIHRRDNLTSAIHMLIEAIFWFHPLVWWIGAKLVEERERACDEAVLARGNEPHVYAEGILNVCKSYLESPLRCVSGVTGSDLKKRIRAILSDRVAGDLNFAGKSALALAAMVALAAPILLGMVAAPSIRTQSAQQAVGRLSFEVASVREWGKGDGPVGAYVAGVQFFPDRVTSQCANLNSLLFYAFHLTMAVPITGLPTWAKASCGESFTDTFRIDATIVPGTTDEQARQMMQTLLEDRFKLVAHWEKKEEPIYALVIRPGGFKLKPSDPKNDAPIPPHSIGCPPDDPGCHYFAGGSGPISQLAGMLTRFVGRPVIDKTGLTGDYNLSLKWAGDTTADSPLPSLTAALSEKFGLELKSQTGPVDVLVIDHVEKPSPN